MAGRTREPGPTSTRTAENLRRIRQEQGLSYAELARRLAGIGHPILDTGLLKIEKGDRRVDVDDLMALAIALGTTPNRLILPPGEPEHATERYHVTSAITGTPPLLWAWATGEVPLGALPSTATTDRRARGEEVVFSRENRPQHWLPDGPQRNGDQVIGTAALIAYVGETFRAGSDTNDIRSIIEGAIIGVLLTADPTKHPKIGRVEDGTITVTLGGDDENEGGEA